MVRDTNGDEDPGQRWLDVSGTRAGSDYGLAIINDAKYGYSVGGSDLRISIARAAVYAHHMPRELDPHTEYVWQDQGLQSFRLLLVPHQGPWQANGIVRSAEEFVAPMPVMYQGIHGGSRPQADSFLAVDVPNVVVAAVKRSEKGNHLILRCVETAGQATAATLDLRFADRQWTGNFRPLEIKTLRLNIRTGAIREVNVLEEVMRDEG